MDFNRLGHSGLHVPAPGFGTATFGGGDDFFKAWGSTDAAGASRLVDVCLDHGASLFDSADVCSAGLAEQILGQAIKGKRNRVLISTKTTFPMGTGPNDFGSSRQHILEAVDASLARLGAGHIDLLQLHGQDYNTPVEETLATLDQLVRSGKVRYVGCPNFSGWHLMKSLAASDRRGYARYVAHQAYCSLLHRDHEWELMPLGRDQGVGAVVWSPLGWGKLPGKIRRNQPAQPGARYCRHGSAVRGGAAVPHRRCLGRGGAGDGQDRPPGGAELAAAPADGFHGRRRRPQRGAARAEHRRSRMAARHGAGGGPRRSQRGHAGLSGLASARLPHAQRAGRAVTGRG